MTSRPPEKENFKENYSRLIIRSVIVFYSVWLTVLVADLVTCSTKSQDSCDEQRAEVRGAATVIPATLLAWLTDSPMQNRP